MEGNDFTVWMAQIQQRTEHALCESLPSPDQVPQRLHEAMRYATLGGGKRVRALLVHAAGELTDAPASRLDTVACAIELVHAYSLVHDDLPCMDNDVLRRGKPTVHVEFDEATALLVGDALQTLAFERMADSVLNDDPVEQLNMLALLATATGSRGMAGGQAIDLASVGIALSLADIEQMHIRKTGALIRAATLLGAQCGSVQSAMQRQSLDRYAKLVGLLFQVIDDILDTQADTATLGKTAGKDANQHKPTYVSLLGLEQAQEFAEDLLSQALTCIEPFGAKALRLNQLASFIVSRKF